MAQELTSLADYLAVLRRQLWLFLVVLVLVGGVALGIAYGLPSVYRSAGTILIEQQDIPPELVQTTVTSYADQRIQLIRQRVMTTSNLLGIVERYNLYAEDRRGKPREVIVDRMTKAIQVDRIKADVVERGGRGTSKATLAFTVGFEDESPQLAQRVANELVTLFLNENVKTRTALASETSAFLSDESKRLADHIGELETVLATFKEQHGNVLPELAELNRQLLDRTEEEITGIGREVSALEERRTMLKGQITLAGEMHRLAAGSDKQALTPAERLAALEEEYDRTATRFTPSHPDMVQLQREIETLRETVARDQGRAVSRALENARAELAELEQRYRPGHPEVERARRTVARLEKEASAGRDAGAAGAETALSPAVFQLSTQLDALEVDIGSAHKRREELELRLKEYEARVAQGPQIEREYRALSRDLENAIAKYREVKAKEMEAQMAQSLETEQKGERFTLIEPPLVPGQPVRPNRPAIAFVGLLLAFGGGFGAVVLREMADATLRGSRAVARVAGALPLAGIPYIVSPADRRRRRRVVAGTAAGLAAAGVAGLAVVHFTYTPLDVLWFVVLRKLGA